MAQRKIKAPKPDHHFKLFGQSVWHDGDYWLTGDHEIDVMEHESLQEAADFVILEILHNKTFPKGEEI